MKNTKKLDKKTKIILIIGIAILIVIAAISIARVVKWSIDNHKTNNIIKEVQKEAIEKSPYQENSQTHGVPDENTPEVVTPPKKEVKEHNPYWEYMQMNRMSINFNKLLKTNKDTVGWIEVKGTNVNYPVVQAKDNKYYMTRSFDGSNNMAGWIYMDYRNNKNFGDQNTILYGHSMLNKTMFGSLHNLARQSWYNDKGNHIIYVSTPTNEMAWQIFSVYDIPTTSDYLYIKFSNEDFLKFANKLKNRSRHKFNVNFTANDKILTLSTCRSGNQRTVVHAKLIKNTKR